MIDGFMEGGCKTQPELGRQNGSHPRFAEPIVRDRWIVRFIDACQVKAPQTDFMLREVLFRQVAELGYPDFAPILFESGSFAVPAGKYSLSSQSSACSD